MKKLFISYINQFPFWGDFLYSDLKKMDQSYNYQTYISIRRWYFDTANKSEISDIEKEYQSLIELNKKLDLERFNNFKKTLKLRIPSPEDLTTYQGMFDEH